MDRCVIRTLRLADGSLRVDRPAVARLVSSDGCVGCGVRRWTFDANRYEPRNLVIPDPDPGRNRSTRLPGFFLVSGSVRLYHTHGEPTMTRRKQRQPHRGRRNVAGPPATAPRARRFKYVLARVALLLGSLVLFLALVETVLHVGLLDQATWAHPTWYPPRLVAKDKEIDLANYRYAQGNPYRFTDKVRTYKRLPGTKRLAVLGDSFIWGDGLPWPETWNHKLERLFQNDPNDKVEVISWGRNGWSTADELPFLITEGGKFELDGLLVGYSTNDPDMGLVRQYDLKWQDAALWRPVKWALPDTFAFVSQGVNRFLWKHTKYGYGNWLDRLYEPDNMKQYREVLRTLAQVAKDRNLPLVVVLTPNNHGEQFRRYFDTVIPLLEELQIPYLDLYPMVKEELGHVPARALAASPVDGHPGVLLTDLFARHTYAYAKAHSPLK